MRKIMMVVFILAFYVSCFAAARPDSKKGKYLVYGLAGGAAGYLDTLDITGAGTPNTYDLIEGDAAEVRIISGEDVSSYNYIFDADGTDAESSPYIIRPDDYSTAGVWRLVKLTGSQMDPADGSDPGTMSAAHYTKVEGIEASADVTDATNVAAAGAVMNTGNESIAGVKTFSDTPFGPTAAPTFDGQFANKKYVDDSIPTESEMESVIDLSDLQGAVTDGQVPNDITITGLSGTNTGDQDLSGYAATTRKLDDFGTPDDNTDLDATTSRHGLLPKLGGGTTNFLRADGSWAEPAGGSATTDASDLTSGTLNDARLSSNVPLKDTTATISGDRTYSGSVTVSGTFSATNGITAGSSATPTMTLEDSDGAGSDDYAADINANMTTTTDGSEVSDVTINYMDAGTKTAALVIDGSDNQIEFGIPVTGTFMLNASGFDGNLATTDDTLQEVAQALDDLSGTGTDDQTLAEVLAQGADANDVNITSGADIDCDSVTPDGANLGIGDSDEEAYMQADGIPDSDDTYSCGMVVWLTAGNAVKQFDLVMLMPDGKVDMANASGVPIGYAVAESNDGWPAADTESIGVCLLGSGGVIRNDAWTGHTAGEIVYTVDAGGTDGLFDPADEIDLEDGDYWTPVGVMQEEDIIVFPVPAYATDDGS